jgi:hypothetical protein
VREVIVLAQNTPFATESLSAMKRTRWILLFGFCATLALAGEVIDSLQIDGKTYDGVKWGPVNQGKVVIFYNQGVAIVPLDKLPPEYRVQFGYTPGTNAPAARTNAFPPALSASPAGFQQQSVNTPAGTADASETSDWQVYVKDRATKFVLDGKLVEKSELSQLTGFLMAVQGDNTDQARLGRLWVLNLAERRKNVPPAPEQFELRPGLWQATDETVVLINYEALAEQGALVRVFGSETKPVNGHRAYIAAKEPSFEEWQKLHAP